MGYSILLRDILRYAADFILTLMQGARGWFGGLVVRGLYIISIYTLLIYLVCLFVVVQETQSEILGMKAKWGRWR